MVAGGGARGSGRRSGRVFGVDAARVVGVRVAVLRGRLAVMNLVLDEPKDVGQQEVLLAYAARQDVRAFCRTVFLSVFLFDLVLLVFRIFEKHAQQSQISRIQYFHLIRIRTAESHTEGLGGSVRDAQRSDKYYRKKREREGERERERRKVGRRRDTVRLMIMILVKVMMMAVVLVFVYA